jgi:hypothetical protein
MATLYSYTPDTPISWVVNSSTYRGQVFTLTSACTITAVQLKVFRVGANPNCSFRLYTTVGGLPNTLSYQQSVDTSGWSTSATVETITLDTPQEVSAGTYAVVLYSTESKYDFATIQVYMSRTNSGAGTGAVTYDSGWEVSTGYGMYLIVTGTVTGHSKTSNPTPADTDTEVDWSTPTLDWDGTGDTYTVYISTATPFIAGDVVATAIEASSYTLTDTQKKTFANLSDVVYWRVDSTADVETLTGDTWTFDPRPGKATVPTPEDTGTDIALSTTLEWTSGTNADTIDLYYTDPDSLDIYHLLDTSEETTYAWTGSYRTLWGKTYSWQVNSTNFYGTTDGDVWTFTTPDMDYVISSYSLIDGGSGDGPLDGGVEGTDFRYTGLNNVITCKRLVAVARDTFYYESN